MLFTAGGCEQVQHANHASGSVYSRRRELVKRRSHKFLHEFAD